MSALEVFDFDGTSVRVVVVGGEAWFIASDVAGVLGYSVPSAMTRTLDEDEKGLQSVHTLGGEQLVALVSEAGVFSVILRSRIERAKMFRRWVTHDVLPSIHRTGTYSVAAAVTEDEIVHQALAITARRVEALREQAAELEPRAEAWDEIEDAGTDYAVRDVAPMLSRAGIETGPQRLFETLHALGWICRGEKNRWTPYARAVDAGYLDLRAMPSYRDRDTGELVLSAPQVRVTPKGVERLRVRLGAGALTR